MAAKILKPGFYQLLSLTFAMLLTAGMVITNLHVMQSDPVAIISITDSMSASTIGADIGGCGLLVGAVGAVAALAVMGMTVGIGGALVISATIHAGAIICAS
ncbi:MAG: hypothetical protein L0226_06875 [Acidobacteria bacterium]|nr:hypothetical protein [Acidobacteriota bacterium]